MERQGTSWTEYRIHVMASLDALKKSNERIMCKLDEMESDITMLKFKAGIWGLAGAALPIVLLLGTAWAKGII